jgi:hypothetical protein
MFNVQSVEILLLSNIEGSEGFVVYKLTPSDYLRTLNSKLPGFFNFPSSPLRGTHHYFQ